LKFIQIIFESSIFNDLEGVGVRVRVGVVRIHVPIKQQHPLVNPYSHPFSDSRIFTFSGECRCGSHTYTLTRTRVEKISKFETNLRVLHVWQFWPWEQIHLIDIGFNFDFVHEDFFSEDFQLANDYSTIRKYIFIAIAAWWLSQFSPTSCQNSLLFRCERILSLTSLLQIICVRMQCSLDDRVYFICQDSLQAIGEEGQWGRKDNEEHWDLIASTPEKQKKIVAEGVCGSHFIVFSNRWVQTQLCLSSLNLDASDNTFYSYVRCIH